MHVLPVRREGDAAGVTLPPDLLRRLGVGVGDSLVVTEGRGGFTIERCPRDVEDAMRALQRTRRKFRRALRDLSR